MKSTKVLLIQFRKNKQAIPHEQTCFTECYPHQQAHKAISVFDDNVGWNNPERLSHQYTHIILGGSSEFGLAKETVHPTEKAFITKQLKKLVEYRANNDLPTLGVCFGHHLIAFLLGGTVARPENEKETGSVTVYINQTARDERIFAGMPKQFMAQTAHIESITKMPPNSRVLAHTDKCKVAAYRIGKNVYGMQFHPEINKKRLIERIKMSDELYHPTNIAMSKTDPIIKNFLKIK